jgi:EmrB/QacA subfamily drug resistance transporter
VATVRTCQGTGQPFVAAGTPAGRWVLLVAVLGSGMAMLDGSVVNVALPRIGADLDADVSALQWVVNAYLLTLASLILVGGGLGDRFGRRRVFHVGVAWFGAASLLCAVAQTADQLVLARLVQGIGGALLTPGSLAIIQSTFRPQDRGKAIGQWAGLGGIAAAIGPPVGGWVVDVATWRWVFWVNVPIAVGLVYLGIRHVPESLDPDAPRSYDVAGSALGVLGLGGITFALIELHSPYAVPFGVIGVLALAAFLWVEHRSAHPLVPMHLFADRLFSVANAMTLLVYGALGAVMFFLVLQLQMVAGFAPWQAGLATLPITVVLLGLSSRSGALAARIGPRPQMSAGPVLCGVGTLMLMPLDAGSSYFLHVLPGLLVFSLGLVALVAPLTACVMAAAPDQYAGVASGINNAIARTGSLLAVAALPALVGLSGADYARPEVFAAGYRSAMLVCSVLLVTGGVVSFVGLRGTNVPAPART